VLVIIISVYFEEDLNFSFVLGSVLVYQQLENIRNKNIQYLLLC